MEWLSKEDNKNYFNGIVTGIIAGTMVAGVTTVSSFELLLIALAALMFIGYIGMMIIANR